jgi:hypothetical protein
MSYCAKELQFGFMLVLALHMRLPITAATAMLML